MKIQYQTDEVIVFESALFRTTSTLINTPDLVLLVDPNWLPIEIDFIKTQLSKIKKRKPLYLLFTHSDYDHIIGYNAFQGAKIIASQEFDLNPNKEKILNQIRDFDDENYILREYSMEYPKVDYQVLEDGQSLISGQTQLHFYLASGHNRDGIFTIIEPYGVFIAGDYLSNIEFPYIYHSSFDYERTLDKVDTIFNRHEIRLLIPGHGDLTRSKVEIQKRKRDSLDYIHRLRETLQTFTDFDFDDLMKSYHFPKIMRQFHEANTKLMKQELGIS